MGGGKKARLELRRCEVDAFIQHALEELCEPRAIAVHRIGDVQGALFAMLPAGTTEDWHVAPRRQFMICLRGIVEVTAADGEKRRILPGQFVLLEDTTGKGHVTHAAGHEDHVALAIPLPHGVLTRK